LLEEQGLDLALAPQAVTVVTRVQESDVWRRAAASQRQPIEVPYEERSCSVLSTWPFWSQLDGCWWITKPTLQPEINSTYQQLRGLTDSEGVTYNPKTRRRRIIRYAGPACAA
jgi:hypothetical protein